MKNFLLPLFLAALLIFVKGTQDIMGDQIVKEVVEEVKQMQEEDEEISYDEDVVAYTLYVKRLEKAFTEEFETYDLDHNGALDLAEVAHSFPEATDEEVKAFLEGCDVDRDGTINLYEFLDSALEIAAVNLAKRMVNYDL
jgi:Ca2+-binding protein (EF-Hand superfamily)